MGANLWQSKGHKSAFKDKRKTIIYQFGQGKSSLSELNWMNSHWKARLSRAHRKSRLIVQNSPQKRSAGMRAVVKKRSVEARKRLSFFWATRAPQSEGERWKTQADGWETTFVLHLTAPLAPKLGAKKPDQVGPCCEAASQHKKTKPRSSCNQLTIALPPLQPVLSRQHKDAELYGKRFIRTCRH